LGLYYKQKVVSGAKLNIENKAKKITDNVDRSVFVYVFLMCSKYIFLNIHFTERQKCKVNDLGNFYWFRGGADAELKSQAGAHTHVKSSKDK
jgi:hypothetical protein